VQRRLLPASPPHVPPFEVFGRYEPCFELGGDFYDFITLPHGLGVAVGDVVGKGLAAGLLMAAVRAMLRAHIEDIYDIDQIIAKVNISLTRDTRDHEFATLFYGTLDARNRRLTYCSAGHEPGLLLRDGHFVDLDVGGMPVGIDAHQKFEKGIIDLVPGDVLMLYTDGVSDASNFEGRRFGRDRVRQAVLAMASGSARDIVNHVLWETRRYVGLNYRPDDMTLVAVKVH
jgi:phosphoserine phosphatase RsbU/P